MKNECIFKHTLDMDINKLSKLRDIFQQVWDAHLNKTNGEIDLIDLVEDLFNGVSLNKWGLAIYEWDRGDGHSIAIVEKVDNVLYERLDWSLWFSKFGERRECLSTLSDKYEIKNIMDYSNIYQISDQLRNYYCG